MLKLCKYELRKNLLALLILIGGLAAIQVWFQTANALHATSSLDSAMVILILYCIACYFAVYIIAISNYYQEISSRTGYLTFMTPVSTLKIILSKMLTVFVIGVILAALLIFLGFHDYAIVAMEYEEVESIGDMVNQVLAYFGIGQGEIAINIVFLAVTYLISFFSTVSLLYLCITLACTFMSNSRIRLLISILIFAVLYFFLRRAEIYLNNLSTPDNRPFYLVDGTIREMLIHMLPSTILSLCVMIACIFITSRLLKERISL